MVEHPNVIRALLDLRQWLVSDSSKVWISGAAKRNSCKSVKSVPSVTFQELRSS